MGPGIYTRVLMGRTTTNNLTFDECHFIMDALKFLLASERSASTPLSVQDRAPRWMSFVQIWRTLLR